MKAVLFIMLWTMAILATSCSKKAGGKFLLAGKWRVVNDSSVNTNKLFSLSQKSNGIESSNYEGTLCPASFSFTAAGILVTSFFNCTYGGPTIDSATSRQTGDQITISIFAQTSGAGTFYTYFNPVFSRTYTVSNLTANAVRLSFGTGGAGGQTEVINLER
jgi:hypothetical protein